MVVFPHLCPVCKKYNFTEPFEFCPICDWQFDTYQEEFQDKKGANFVTLNEAKENYKKYKKSYKV